VNCADCGQLLVDRDDEHPLDDESTARGEPASGDAELVGFEVIRTSRDIYALTPLADHLLEAGMDCRIRGRSNEGRSGGYVLLVPTTGRAAALAALDTLAPSGPGLDEAGDLKQGYTQCPACDTPIALRSVACPECGLALAEITRECPHCEASVDADANRCGSCGETLDPAD
jgi:hypothetical protein